jgi:hypothetical protein
LVGGKFYSVERPFVLTLEVAAGENKKSADNPNLPFNHIFKHRLFRVFASLAAVPLPLSGIWTSMPIYIYSCPLRILGNELP